LDTNAQQLKEFSQGAEINVQQFAGNYDEYVVFLQRVLHLLDMRELPGHAMPGLLR
jgi:hypothetical protein